MRRFRIAKIVIIIVYISEPITICFWATNDFFFHFEEITQPLLGHWQQYFLALPRIFRSKSNLMDFALAPTSIEAQKIIFLKYEKNIR